MQPYSEYAHAFHTGSFTSRAALKGYIRESASIFASARLMQLLAALPADLGPSNPLYRLERALGIAQVLLRRICLEELMSTCPPLLPRHTSFTAS